MRDYNINIPAGLKAIKRLLQDKGNTQSYVDINVALNGKSYLKRIEEWSQTPQGKRYLKGERLPLDKKYKKGS